MAQLRSGRETVGHSTIRGGRLGRSSGWHNRAACPLVWHLLVPYDITQKDLASRIGVSFVRVNEIVNRKRGVAPRRSRDS
jgi:hypothetical protein